MRLAHLLARRRAEPSRGPLLLGQRNIYVLPTRWGWSFAALILLFLLISTNYSNNLGFLLAFLLAAMALGSAVHGQRNLAGLTVQPGKTQAVFLGEALPYTLRLINPTRRPRFALAVSAGDCEGRTLSWLDGGSDAAVVLLARPLRRGPHSPGVVVLETRFPLGLFRAWSRFGFVWQGLVYPAAADSAKPFPRTPAHSGTGAHSGEDDFAGFRAYQAGDALRLVHWKSYAKGQGLSTRLFRQGEPQQDRLWLDWSLAEEAGVEAKLSRLCRWVLDAEAAGLDYGLRLPGREIPPSRGQTHRDACLEALALFQP